MDFELLLLGMEVVVLMEEELEPLLLSHLENLLGSWRWVESFVGILSRVF